MFNPSPKQVASKKQNILSRKTNFFLIDEGYNEDEAILEASRCLSCHNPTCQKGCPINNDIPIFIKHIANKEFYKAYEVLINKTCMSEVCGNVCPHEKQCMGHCIRGLKQESVNIGALEAFVAKWARQNNVCLKKDENNKHCLAVIGSGPASLAFAYKALLKGYQVSIYEKDDHLGGILYWGIPSYRLDREILADYIDKLKKLGVRIFLNYQIGEQHSLKELTDKYDYVFIGGGCSKAHKMNIEGENLSGVYSADTFLRLTNLANADEKGQKSCPECGENVVVTGGGNVALDAARNAIRLKNVKRVTLVYRRSEIEMPSCQKEIKEAKEEGIEILTLTNPVKFIGKNNKLAMVECALMELGEKDESGRRRPIESNKPHIFIDADSCVLALGFSSSDEIYKSTNIAYDKYGCIIVDENGLTSMSNVYAGGDITSGPKSVVLAMKAGMKAFNDIDKKINKDK